MEKHIYVPTPEDKLQVDVEETILNFKMKKLEQKINSIDSQFPYATDDDERLMLMAQKMQLNKIRQKLGAALNRVVG